MKWWLAARTACPRFITSIGPPGKSRKIGDDDNLIRQFGAMPGRIYAVEYSRDGRRIVAGSSNQGTGEIRVYNAASTQLICKFQGEPGPIYTARFSPDGHQVAAAGFSGKVLLMDAATGKAGERIYARAVGRRGDGEEVERRVQSMGRIVS